MFLCLISVLPLRYFKRELSLGTRTIKLTILTSLWNHVASVKHASIDACHRSSTSLLFLYIIFYGYSHSHYIFSGFILSSQKAVLLSRTRLDGICHPTKKSLCKCSTFCASNAITGYFSCVCVMFPLASSHLSINNKNVQCLMCITLLSLPESYKNQWTCSKIL